jgi:hypothetical protein
MPLFAWILAAVVAFIVLHVISVFTIGRWIACVSLRTLRQYTCVSPGNSVSLTAWVLFPFSAANTTFSEYYCNSFQYGRRAFDDDVSYMTAVAWMWPLKLAINFVVLTLVLGTEAGEAALDKIYSFMSLAGRPCKIR